MVLFRLPLLLLFLPFFSLFLAFCFSPFVFSTFSPSSSSSFCSAPSSAAHSLVCSCSSSSSLSPSSIGHLRLTFSSLPPLLHHLVVHSCHRLTIASGTFRGKTVLEHIKLLDIARLDIRSDAFRAIRRSPRLFLLQNAHLPAVPSRAFTGLSRLQHFWWRNISIGRVHENAFAKMAFVDYLYFHTANIKTIDSGAFGHIHHLGHFFLRDGIRIGRMGARVFCGTRVDELAVEQATVKADEAVFGGLRAAKVRISDCWWGATGGRRGRKGRGRRQTRQEAVAVGEMLIRNCTMHRLPYLGAALISLFRVEHSIIGRLMKGGNPQENVFSGTPLVPSSFRLSSRTELEWHWHSLPSNSNTMPTRSPTILNISSIPKFSHSLTKVVPLQLRILYSNIRLLFIPFGSSPTSTLSPSIFFINSSVRRWVGSPFAVPSFSPIRRFLIEDSRLDEFVPSMTTATIDEGPFSHLSVIDSFQFVRSQLGNGAQLSDANGTPPPFGGSKIGTLELAECRLKRAPGSAFLQGVEVRERLIVKGTQWPCASDHCGTEGLFLAPNSHRNLHWQFTSNHCFEENNFTTSNNSFSPSVPSSHSSSSICASSDASSSTDFMCRQLGPLEECMCRGPFATTVPHSSSRRHLLPMSFPSSSSSALLLLVGDCSEHSLVLQSSAFPPSVQSLYIFRVRHLIIRSIPPSLRHLSILHTSVSIANSDAFASANLFQLAVDGSDLVGPMPTGGKLRKGDIGKLGQIRLDRVNDGWREVISKLTENQQRWGEDKNDGTGRAMAMPRRRGVQQNGQRTKEEQSEEEEEGQMTNGRRHSGRTMMMMMERGWKRMATVIIMLMITLMTWVRRC